MTPHARPGRDHDGLLSLKRYKRFYLHQDKERSQAKRSLQAYAKQMRESDQSCLMLDDYGNVCGRPSRNRCHAIPERPILRELADRHSGKVFELRWSLDAWRHALSKSSRADPIDLFSAEMFQPQRTPLETGTGNASAGHYACKPHDVKVFGPIDVALPDFQSREVLLLTVYRTLLFVTDITRGPQAMMFDPKLGRIARDHESPEVRRNWEEQKKTPPYSLLRPYLSEFHDIWRNRRSTVSVIGEPILFRSRLRFAACGMLSSPLQVVYVHPVDGDRHRLIVIQVGPEDRSASEARGRLESAALAAQGNDSEDVRLVCKIMRLSAGTVVASTESYDSLTGWERRHIQAMIGHNSGARGVYKLLEPKLLNPPRTTWTAWH